jgi:uncharacterized protein YktA (UPF0223 family)
VIAIDEYNIDYDMFSVEEIIKFISFFRLIEQTKIKKISRQVLTEQYRQYRSILNNIALEKKYDSMLLKKSGISIYRTMKNLH